MKIKFYIIKYVWETENKTADINTTTSVTLNVNGLKNPIKSQKLSDQIKKKIHPYVVYSYRGLQGTYF